MSDLTNDPKTQALLARAQNIIMKPATEWDVIAAEPATVKSLYVNYALILAAIPAVCMTLGNVIFAHVGLLHGISSGLAQYVLALFGTAALALSVDMLVPQFNGVQNQVQAFKLAIYSATPGWIAGALFLLNRSYLAPLGHGSGIAMIAIGSVLLALGSFWLSRIVKIKV